MTGLNPTNSEPGYLCGRLFAHLEALELAAEGGYTLFEGKFANAVRNPTITLNFERARAGTWLKRLTYRHGKPEEAERYRATFAELVERIDPHAECQHANQQYLFTLGYHHQRYANDRAAGEILTTAELAPVLGYEDVASMRKQLSRWEQEGLEGSGRDQASGERLWRLSRVQAMPRRGRGRPRST